MHAAYAVSDVFELLFALVAALVEEVVEELVEEVALDDPLPPHALNATDPTSATARKESRTRRGDRVRSTGDDGLLRRTVPSIS